MRAHSFIDIVGRTFGRLTVIKNLGTNKNQKSVYECKCECGNTIAAIGGNLVQGKSTSCGCFRSEGNSERSNKINAALVILITTYKKGAKDRNLEWSLTDDQFIKLTSSPCYYTGRLPSKEIHSRATRYRRKFGLPPFPGGIYLYNGIDRLDNSKGYTIENCVPSCTDANKAKLTMTHDEFISLCKEVAQHHRV